ncbi:MAG: hypothetical protein ACP5JA_02240 [Thermodesulfovibrio sp.]
MVEEQAEVQAEAEDREQAEQQDRVNVFALNVDIKYHIKEVFHVLKKNVLNAGHLW